MLIFLDRPIIIVVQNITAKMSTTYLTQLFDAEVVTSKSQKEVYKYKKKMKELFTLKK